MGPLTPLPASTGSVPAILCAAAALGAVCGRPSVHVHAFEPTGGIVVGGSIRSGSVNFSSRRRRTRIRSSLFESEYDSDGILDGVTDDFPGLRDNANGAGGTGGGGGGGGDALSRPFFASPAAPTQRRNGNGNTQNSPSSSPYVFNGGATFGDNAGNGGDNGYYLNSPTAPEVNKWTTLMADGTNAAIYRPGKKDMSTDEEAMEVLYNDLLDLSDFDIGQIETYWGRIMPTVAYLGTEGCFLVKQALRVAYRAHREQRRKSGEPFIIHPVEVALLLAGLKMDAETVAAGLLHDTVEDTDLTFSQVEAMFGKVVRTIVEGETKVSKLPKLVFNDYADEQAENLRQMFVAMTEDYRIIIVKLADRLHNMRTLQHMKPEKQVKISRETLDIFAPLAHRMGIWQFKSELEDTAFMYLYPAEYRRLNRELRRYQTKFRETLDKSKEILEKTLDADPILRDQAMKIEVFGRTKELYSLWHKMETKADHDLDHIADVVALRVILTPKEPKDTEAEKNVADRGVWLCYHVLGLVQHLPGFQPVPTRVKDYISFPKPNGYQSLHTALNLNGQMVEVQIRTATMHQVAEYGMASHWAYTDSKRRTEGDVFNTPWLSSIKEWQDDVVSSRDFVDCVRRELLGKRVFVFLRNGKILNLARGATVIDAAFQIHTEVGLAMHGAEINGKPVPFAYELQNGDVVSILTGKGTPQIDWMRYAKSRSTRSKLRSYFRTKQKESLREAGKILLHDFLAMHKDLIVNDSFLSGPIDIPIDDLERINNYLPGRTRYRDLDQLLVAIGKSHNRSFLRSIVSKIFKVPLARFTEAEESKKASILESVTSSVLRSRKMARDAAAAAEEAAQSNNIGEEVAGNGEEFVNGNYSPSTNGDMYGMSINTEIADPDHLCEDCLPVLGDEIIGTKPVGDAGIGVTATVHRRGCPHAERALHRSPSAANSIASDENSSRRFTNRKVNYTPHEEEVAVALQWPEPDEKDEVDDVAYLAEVVLVAADRKMLLADCSEAVSRCSEIVRTGSTTTNEHAILEFLVQVSNVDEIQTLMDELNEIDSVMSVERRLGSELKS